MHPEVRQGHPGACPKCGMALEPESLSAPETRTEYTCPMHPEIVQDRPGSCPKCGMALEPQTVTAEEKNAELIDMTRRFWVSTALALPLFVLAMVADLAPGWLPDGISMRTRAVDRVCPGHAGGVVGRLAILRARLAVGADLESEHVHADRAGRGRRLGLQRRCPPDPAGVSVEHAHGRRHRPCLLRGGGHDHGPGAAGAGAGAAGAREHQRGHQAAARSGPQHRPTGP